MCVTAFKQCPSRTFRGYTALEQRFRAASIPPLIRVVGSAAAIWLSLTPSSSAWKIARLGRTGWTGSAPAGAWALSHGL